MDILNNIQQILTEARSHKDVNVRLPLYELLEPYSNDNNYFIHFSDELKVGINPKSEWGNISAYGVYAYTAHFVFKLLFKSKYINRTHDFGFDKNYVTLLEKVDVPNYKFLYIDDNYNNEEDLIKLKNYFEEISKPFSETPSFRFKIFMNKMNDYFNKKELTIDLPSKFSDNRVYSSDNFFYINYGVYLIAEFIQSYNLMKSKHIGSIITKIFLNVLNYSGICDINNKGSMHTDIKYETCFFHPKSYKIIKTFINEEDNKYEGPSDEYEGYY